MLKKSLIVQALLLITGITLGMFLLNQFDPGLKTIHATVGILIGLASFASVYFAFREKASASLLTLVIIAAVLAVMAYAGGKLTATHYDLGMMVMRGSAIAALLVCIYSIYKTKNVRIK